MNIKDLMTKGEANEKFGKFEKAVPCTFLMAVVGKMSHFVDPEFYKGDEQMEACSVLAFNENTGLYTFANLYQINSPQAHVGAKGGTTKFYPIPAQNSAKWDKWKTKGYTIINNDDVAELTGGVFVLVEAKTKAEAPKAEAEAPKAEEVEQDA